VSVRFRRWLAVEGSDFDHARLSVSLDSIHWVPVWQNPAETVIDSAWTELTYDLSAIADYRKTVFLRWEMGPTDSSVEYGGWTLDDIQILGVFDPSPPSRVSDQYIVF
jgi:hypothetical protein